MIEMYPDPADFAEKNRILQHAENSLRQNCRDCKGYVPMYYLHDDLWMNIYTENIQVWSPSHNPQLKLLPGRLCFRCAEKRLGRKLVLDDFKEHDTNAAIRFGFNLKSNLDSA